MNENIIAILFIIMIFTSGIITGGVIKRASMQKEAVSQGCAEYNPTTGKWQWKNQ